MYVLEREREGAREGGGEEIVYGFAHEGSWDASSSLARPLPRGQRIERKSIALETCQWYYVVDWEKLI